jgi:hypothetical protein
MTISPCPGDTNTSAQYSGALETLYGLSYAIKMNTKKILEYVVPPLEGFWRTADDFKGNAASVIDNSKFAWTMLIPQPDFVTPEVFEGAKTAFAQRKPNHDPSRTRLTKITEGLCVQIMHIGSYDHEPTSIAAMKQYAVDNGYAIVTNDARRHREIYLSDPRKTAPRN